MRIGQSCAPMTTKMQVIQNMIYGKYVYPQNSTKQMHRVQHGNNTVCAFLRKTDSSSYQKWKLVFSLLVDDLWDGHQHSPAESLLPNTLSS